MMREPTRSTSAHPSFHIPALILGEGIAPKTRQRITSQIDLAPTLPGH